MAMTVGRRMRTGSLIAGVLLRSTPERGMVCMVTKSGWIELVCTSSVVRQGWSTWRLWILETCLAGSSRDEARDFECSSKWRA